MGGMELAGLVAGDPLYTIFLSESEVARDAVSSGSDLEISDFAETRSPIPELPKVRRFTIAFGVLQGAVEPHSGTEIPPRASWL